MPGHPGNFYANLQAHQDSCAYKNGGRAQGSDFISPSGAYQNIVMPEEPIDSSPILQDQIQVKD